MTYPTTWFRLTEVLALSRHALACTGARRDDDNSALPGGHLEWSTITGLDRLTCPGTPDSDDRRQPPAATAAMWRPERRRGPQQTFTADRMLPLADGPAPLITALRQATAAGKHWVSLTPEGTGGAASAVHFHRTTIAPANTTWSTAEVVAAQAGSDLYPHTPRAYPALVADGWRDHRGGLLPRFTRATAADIVTDVSGHLDCLAPSDAARLGLMALDWHGDTIVITRLSGATVGEVDRCGPDRDGFWALGAYLWDWQHPSDTTWPHITAQRGSSRLQ